MYITAATGRQPNFSKKINNNNNNNNEPSGFHKIQEIS